MAVLILIWLWTLLKKRAYVPVWRGSNALFVFRRPRSPFLYDLQLVKSSTNDTLRQIITWRPRNTTATVSTDLREGCPTPGNVASLFIFQPRNDFISYLTKGTTQVSNPTLKKASNTQNPIWTQSLRRERRLSKFTIRTNKLQICAIRTYNEVQTIFLQQLSVWLIWNFCNPNGFF